MAAFFIDLDGTFFRFGTHEPVAQAADTVRRLRAEGHQVYFVTLRTEEDPKLGKTATENRLRELGVEWDGILWRVRSPRVLVNDDGASAISHKRNSPLLYDSLHSSIG